MRRVREDALPENKTYSDDGCRYAARCLECPFSVCVTHDLGRGGIMAYFNEPRNETIRALKAAGAPVEAITREFGVSERTVFRITSESTYSASSKAVIRG